MECPRRTAGMAAAGLLILFAMVVTAPTAGAEEDGGSIAGDNAPIVIIEMDNKAGRTSAEPGTLGLVVFYGSISVYFQEYLHVGEYYNLTLSAVSGNGYTTRISPQYINSSYGGSDPITVSVKVPPETPYDTVDQVTIGGTCTLLPNGTRTTIHEETVFVLVEQYHRFEVSLEEEYIKTRGGLEEYHMTIHNRGNGPDSFILELDQTENIRTSDLTVALSHTSVRVEAGETETMTIGVANGEDTENFHVHAVSMHVSSGGARNDGLPLSEQVYIYYRLNDHWLGPEGFAGLIAFIILLTVMMVFVVRFRRRKLVRFRLAQRRDK